MARNQYERQKKALEQKMQAEVAAYNAIINDNEELTDEHKAEIAERLKTVRLLKTELEEVESSLKTLDEVNHLGRSIGVDVPSIGSVQMGDEPHDRMIKALNGAVFQQAQKSVGEQFVESEGYKSVVKRYRESGSWGEFSTGAVSMQAKGTLLEGSSSPGSGSGGGLLPVPQVVPGVTTTLFQRLTVADLLMEGQASGNTIRYVIEGTATSGAAGVAEAGSKPESVLGVGTKDEPIKKIATFLPISDEMLEDAPAVQSYINGRLTLFVRIEEERQLLRGASGGNEVQGLLTSRSVPVLGTATWVAADDIGSKLFKGLNNVRTGGFLEPEWGLIHPTDWASLRLLKDGAGGTAGQYFGGGPFLGPYGGPQGPSGASNQINGGAQDLIWGKPFYVTTAIGAGTALVGTSSSAQVWRRGGLSVEASNSHSNYFQLNLVALRAEERLGLAVYRPSGFTEIHFTTA